MLRADDLRCGDTVHGAAQLDVHQHQIGMELLRQGDRVFTRPCLRGHLVTHVVQLQADIVCNNGFVFNQKNGSWTHQMGFPGGRVAFQVWMQRYVDAATAGIR